MATTSREREKQRERVSAARRLEEHKTGDRPALRLPDGMQMLNPKRPGTYRIEIIPYVVSIANANPYCKKVGKMAFERTYFVHRDVGPNQDAHVCLAKTCELPCPICEHRSQIARDPKTPEDVIKGLAPKERQLFNIFDHAEPAKGVQVWEISFHNFGKHLDKKINNADEDEKEKYQQFADPEVGLTLKLGGSEETMGKGKPFMVFSDIEFKDRKEPLDPDVLSQAADLDKIVVITPYEKLKKLYLQLPDPEADKKDDDDDDDDEAPAAKAAPAKAPVKEPEPEPESSPYSPVKDDLVEYKYKGKTKEGKILAVNPGKKLCKIEVEGQEMPAIVDFDDIIGKVEADTPAPEANDDDGWDETPAEKPAAKPATKEKAPTPATAADDGETTAESLGITLGCSVKHPELGVCEVIHIAGDGSALRLEDTDGDIHKGIKPSDVKLVKSKEAAPAPAKAAAKPAEKEDDGWDDDPDEPVRPKKK